MMKVLITGGAGFIGSHLAEACLRGGFNVAVLDDLSLGKRSQVPAAADFYKLDIRSSKLAALVKRLKPTHVCHLAAQPSVTRSLADPALDADVNIVGSLNLLQAVRPLDIKKFLFVSSAALYGEARELPTPEEAELRPASPYALAKHTVERFLSYYALSEGFPAVIVRPANVYGPRQLAAHEGGVVARFVRAALKGETLTIEGKGEQTRDFVHVADVAAGMMSALLKGQGVYNLATGTELSIRELVVRIGEVLNRVPLVDYAPPRQGDLRRSCLSNRRARRELDWEPQVPLVEGLRLTLKWASETRGAL